MTFDIIICTARPIQNFLSRWFYFGLDSSRSFFQKEEIYSSFQNEGKTTLGVGTLRGIVNA
jgi:hypothetical protein